MLETILALTVINALLSLVAVFQRQIQITIATKRLNYRKKKIVKKEK